MNQIAMKTLTTTIITAIFLASSITVLVAATPIPNWDVTGDWIISVDFNGAIYDHDFTLSMSYIDGEFTGVGGYPAGGSYTLTEVISGDIVGDQISWHSEYNENGYYWDAIATIDSDGKIVSGTWSSNAGQTGTLVSIDGAAEPYIISLAFPDGSEVTPSVKIIEEGELLPCTPILPEGITPYIAVEITAGEFDGTVKVGVRYEDSYTDENEELTLRLFMNDCVDFNLDFTINGKDMKLMRDAIMEGVDGDEVSSMLVAFDVNHDGEVDWTDFKIVKEYATKGLIVNDGLFGLEQRRLPWIDITTEVDTDNNIIYGETDHFSVFRCR